MLGYNLRSATPNDADALARVIDAAYATYAERLTDLPKVSECLAEDINTHLVWVAEAEDKLIGGLVLIIQDTCAVLANVAVAPDHGGKGVGRALIDRAVEESVQRGLAEIRLSTHVEMPENVRLYERLGWSVTDTTGSKIHMSRLLSR